MKKLIISSAALAVVFGTALAAPQDNDNDNNRHRTRAERIQQRNDQAPTSNTQNISDRQADRADRERNRDRNDVNADNRNVDVNRNVTVQKNVRVNRNVDIVKYRRNVTATHRYRGPRWYQPASFRYVRYSYGQRLPRVYFVRDYWLTNFWAFGLFAPPPGYVWVRYGSDALLIDEFTGEIVQVQYNIFF